MGIEAAFVVGACLVTLGGWISANFGTQEIENAPTAKRDKAETAASNVVLPGLETQPKANPGLEAQAQTAPEVAATSQGSLSGLLQLGQFSHGKKPDAPQNPSTHPEDAHKEGPSKFGNPPGFG